MSFIEKNCNFTIVKVMICYCLNDSPDDFRFTHIYAGKERQMPLEGKIYSPESDSNCIPWCLS